MKIDTINLGKIMAESDAASAWAPCRLALVLSLFLPALQATAQPAPPRTARTDAAPSRPTGPVVRRVTQPDELDFDDLELKFENTPLDIVLMAYASRTGLTLLRAPGLPTVNITLRSGEKALTEDEYLQAIETVLGLHGIALVPTGEKFVKVVASKDVRRLGIRTDLAVPEEGAHAEIGQMVSQVIELRHIDINEVKTVLEGLKRPDGQMQFFERTNSILVTDSADNVNRMLEIMTYLDQPLVTREEANVRQIRYAKASDIKSRLMEIVAEQQRAQQERSQRDVPQARTTGGPGIERRTPEPPIPGVIRPGRRVEEPDVDSVSDIFEALVEEAERGVIRGKVQIVADDRTNMLIVLTRPENMTFFDRIIDVLDVETAPDVIVEVLRLEHADAKEVATMLNDLIGQSAADSTPRAGGDRVDDGAAERDDRSARLTEFADRVRRETGIPQEATRSRIGELSKDHIKILANERTNALVLMASPSDLTTLKEIIRDMDIMLSQVLIETVILEVNLDDSLETGVDWVQRAMLAYSGGGSDRELRAAFASRAGGGTLRPIDPLTRTTADSFSQSGGLSHYLTLFGLNLDVVLRASSTDSRTRILSSPVILTQDNKDATIEATTRQYFLKGTRYISTVSGQDSVDDVEQRDVGITLKVTPRINARGFVVMSVEQAVENIVGTQRINEGDWPIVSSRRIGAEIAVSSGETVVLGGLVLNNRRNVQSGVPLLRSVPLLGWFFRSTRIEDSRSEVVVFLTPYVLDTPDELAVEARRRYDSIGAGGMWEHGWSRSHLSEGAPPRVSDAEDQRRSEPEEPVQDRAPLEAMEREPVQITIPPPEQNPINQAPSILQEGEQPREDAGDDFEEQSEPLEDSGTDDAEDAEISAAVRRAFGG